MLPTDLLMSRPNGEEMVPKRLPLDGKSLAIATHIIALFHQSQGQPQKELDRLLQELEGETTDYRIKRGLAHLLKSETLSTFEIISPLDPQLLRQRVFALSAQSPPLPQTASATLATLATQLSEELTHEVLPDQIRTGLYADLSENRILTQFNPPTPEALQPFSGAGHFL
jgi:uncharacterized protein